MSDPSIHVATESSHEEELQETPITSRPGLVPLFILCVLTMGVGFFFAMQRNSSLSDIEVRQDDARADTVWSAKVALEEGAPLELSSVPVPVQQSLDHAVWGEYRFEQYNQMTSSQDTQDASQDAVHTTLSFGVDWREFKSGEGLLGMIKNSRFQVDSGKQQLNEQLLRQVQERLNKVTMTATYHSAGVVDRLSFDADVPPMMAPVLKLVEGGVVLLSTSLPDKPVLPGASWTYSVPLAGMEVDTMTMTGQVDVTATFKGVLRKDDGQEIQIISQVLTVSLSGATRDAKVPEQTYSLTGQGHGLLQLDVESKLPLEHGMVLDTVLVVEPEGGESFTQSSKLQLSYRQGQQGS